MNIYEKLSVFLSPPFFSYFIQSAQRTTDFAAFSYNGFAPLIISKKLKKVKNILMIFC